jgi:hypothetical protein
VSIDRLAAQDATLTYILSSSYTTMSVKSGGIQEIGFCVQSTAVAYTKLHELARTRWSGQIGCSGLNARHVGVVYVKRITYHKTVLRSAADS